MSSSIADVSGGCLIGLSFSFLKLLYLVIVGYDSRRKEAPCCFDLDVGR